MSGFLARPSLFDFIILLRQRNSYCYDQNGNMVRRVIGGMTYMLAYDAENHMTGYSGGSVNASSVYDGNGQRVIATEGVTTTVFVGDYFEYNVTASEITKYYFAGGVRLAMQRGSNGVKFILGDHLGSASVVLNADGTQRGVQGYYPWGEIRFVEGEIETRYTYTGQYEYVSGFGMMFYNARWYLPELGRFGQADTIIPEAQQGTIAWDRFAGLNNNPVKYTDPSGHRVSDGCDIEGCNISFADANYQEKREYYETCFIYPDSPECPRYKEIALFIVASLGLASSDILLSAILVKLSTLISSIITSICIDGNCTNEAEALKKFTDIMYRNASGTADSLTPRSIDVQTGGLSFFSNLKYLNQGKFVAIDASKLENLVAVLDNNPPGHVTVSATTLAELQAWAATRGTGIIHPLTQELLSLILFIGKK